MNQARMISQTERFHHPFCEATTSANKYLATHVRHVIDKLRWRVAVIEETAWLLPLLLLLMLMLLLLLPPLLLLPLLPMLAFIVFSGVAGALGSALTDEGLPLRSFEAARLASHASALRRSISKCARTSALVAIRMCVSPRSSKH